MKIKRLKDQFTFEYNNIQIEVEKVGDVHCAVFGAKRVPLLIEFGKDGTMGTIKKLETGVILTKLPLDATYEVEPIQVLHAIKNMLNTYDF